MRARARVRGLLALVAGGSLRLLAVCLLVAAGLLAACAGDDRPSATSQARLAPTTSPDDPPGVECAGETTGSLQVTPAAVPSGGTATVSWSVTRPSSCRFPIELDGQPVEASGSRQVTALASQSYTLVLSIPGGSKTLARAALRAEIAEGSVVEIKGSTGQWRDLLVQALATKNATVRLSESVDMDLSGLENIYITEGVTLTSERCLGPSRKPTKQCRPVLGGTGVVSGRTPQKLGPRLYTKTRPKPLFVIRCNSENIFGDRVRLYGFRLHGPHFGMEEGDANLERGIMVSGCVGIEIANLEVAGWSGQGIYVIDENSRINNFSDIRIHDNFFHHNQHKGGNGYGVVTKDGAYALIERNVFDFNRHAISSDGTPTVGYDARHNLVLKGGGVHGTRTNPNTHQFDVHGTDSCGIGHLNCGTAGDRFSYRHNAFQYVKDNAIKIRGKPKRAIYIENNVFAHDDLTGGDVGNGAINLNDGEDRISIGRGAKANTTDTDTYGQYGVCDFDGDGTDDLFLPTGVSWWYSSGGRMQWSFLSTYTERLHQVLLGYFDDDQRCDVLAVNGNQWELSSGGSAPWRSLGTYGVPIDQLRVGYFSGVRDHRAGRVNRRTDVFRRAPNGEWSVVTPGRQDWRVVGSSSQPLAKLRFGDFTNDGITDVLAVTGGRWAISRNATGPWETLNAQLSTDLSATLVADLNGNGTDDVVRLRLGPNGFASDVSWEGRSDLKSFSPGGRLVYAGRFDGKPGAELLLVDSDRVGRLFDRASGKLVAHSLYAY